MKMFEEQTATAVFGLLTKECRIILLTTLALYSSLLSVSDATSHQSSYRTTDNNGALQVGM